MITRGLWLCTMVVHPYSKEMYEDLRKVICLITPRIRFLPIKLNKGNPIIEKAALPDTLHLSVVGGGSLIPDRDQTMEVIGWFPNGTVAIGVVRYGDGHLYMVAPHPSITLENSGAFMKRLVSGPYARAWGVTEEQVSEALSILDEEARMGQPRTWH